MVPVQCCASSATSRATYLESAQVGGSLPSSWPQSVCAVAAQTAQPPMQETMSGSPHVPRGLTNACQCFDCCTRVQHDLALEKAGCACLIVS